jgi:hypothetical protein
MIEFPEFENIIWNPVVSWQLGVTAEQDTVLIVNVNGETGERATLVFPDRDYMRGVTAAIKEGYEKLNLATNTDFNTAASTISGTDDMVPDDISSLINDEED